MTATINETSRPEGALRRAGFALRTKSFRWWFSSQVLSASGSMTQMVAQSWLILQLGGRPIDLGLLGVITWTPVLLGGAWAGAFVDRHNRRRLLLITQSAAILLCLVQAQLIAAGQMRIWMIFAFGAVSGAQTAFDMPARQIYVLELVGAERLASAVGLYEVMLNASRVIGPAIGGVILATVGTPWCFVVNALSYTPVLMVLLRFRPEEATRTSTRTKTAFADGVRTIWRDPLIRTCVLVAVAGGMLFNLSVTVPLLSSQVFHLGGGGYGAMMAAFGVGAVPGALMAAACIGEPTGRLIRRLTAGTGAAILVTAFAPVSAVSFVAIAVTGFLSIWLIASANTLVQLRAEPSQRGLTMGIWTMALPGSIPLTGLLIALVAQYLSARVGFGLAGFAMLAVVLIAADAGVPGQPPAGAGMRARPAADAG